MSEPPLDLETILVKLYAAGLYDRPPTPAYVAVAELCDKELDPSGAMLGRIRDRAYAMHPKPPCPHSRLTEDGICRACGQDCRGVGT